MQLFSFFRRIDAPTHTLTRCMRHNDDMRFAATSSTFSSARGLQLNTELHFRGFFLLKNRCNFIPLAAPYHTRSCVFRMCWCHTQGLNLSVFPPLTWKDFFWRKKIYIFIKRKSLTLFRSLLEWGAMTSTGRPESDVLAGLWKGIKNLRLWWSTKRDSVGLRNIGKWIRMWVQFDVS